MRERVTVTLDGVNYVWDGRQWTDTDGVVSPTGLAARLAALLPIETRSRSGRRKKTLDLTALNATIPADRPVRVLVTGTREWTDRAPIERELGCLVVGSVVIHGAARGADRLAGEVAAALGLTVIACPADWKKFGRAAGLVRNRSMLAEHKPDLVLAFHPALDKARGTRHMVELACKAGVPVRLVTGDAEVAG
jgi:hypothetical protein